MFRFGMSRDDECSRCGETETYKHLFWECERQGKYGNHLINMLGAYTGRVM